VKKRARRGCLWRILKILVVAVVFVVAVFATALVFVRFIDPPTTVVQIQRRVEALASRNSYTKRQRWLPLSRISRHLQHAVVAAEDARFYQHSGIDWKEVSNVVEQSRETGEPPRGASTLTQQLVKNLFFTTHRNPARKAFEYPLAPLADTVLGKQRTLELYLNVVEWGPGVYGAEAAAQYHYGIPASRLNREQATRLAAILPSPRHRKPERMNEYSRAILHRMQQMGW
jgi:monofunctional biosynthetic peptidoglycan transglycosylase